MTTTPDIESDLVAKLAALLPSVLSVSGSTRNLWAGPERPTLGVVPRRAVFVIRSAEYRTIYGGGQYRYLSADIVIRSALDDYAGGELLARSIYDALHLLGRFTGASGQAYEDVRASDAPAYQGQADDDPHYWVLPVQLWADT